MNRLIALTIAVLSFVFLFGVVNNSDAIEIVELRSYNNTNVEYDYGYPYFTFFIRTDLPFDMVYWSVDGQPAGDSDDEGNIKEVYFSFPNLPGSVFGTTYNIEAVAQTVLDENNNIDSDTENYYFTVYTVPVTDEITSGNWTMATMYGEVDVGWNGTTAEATAYGKITNNTPYDIVYGIRIHYVVGMLQRNNDNLAQHLDVPDQLPIDFGVIKAYADDNDEDYSYSDSYTLGDGERAGRRYIVEAKVTITAQISGGDPNEIDVLSVPEQQTLTIPD